MLLIDYVRDELGLPCRGLGWGKHVGWTTDPQIAEKLRRGGQQ